MEAEVTWSQRINNHSYQVISSFLQNSATNSQNLLFSPLSIYVCLGMLNEGIREEAAKQLNNYFNFNSDQNFDGGLETSAIQEILKIFSIKQLKIANGIFCSETFPINPDYVKLIKSKYQGESQNVDFASQEGIDGINQWVQTQTNNCIKSIIDQPHPLIVCLLANALYFKANWKFKFDPQKSESRQFRSFLGETLTIPFMRQENRFRFELTDDLTLLEIVYDECPVSMVFAMEKSGNPITNQNSVISEFLQGCGNPSTQKANVRIPKFKFENTHELKPYFNDQLSLLFQEAMNPKICSAVPTYVSSILHKTFVQVDEVGTEAAATTAVVMMTRCAPVSPPDVNIDKSFHFYIVDHNYKLILFTGFVNKPVF